MKHILKKLYDYQSLSKQEAQETMRCLASSNTETVHIASFLTVFLMRKPTIDEMSGFIEAMLEMASIIPLPSDAIDIVGTGGDEKNSFNISTLSALVLAGAGIKVIKHGNYGTTSVSGSSNVLEYLGYRFVGEADLLQKQLQKSNICFLHAPLFHPAMKNIAAIRKTLGVKSFFNLLGPLLNPAQPKFQLLGVSHLSIARVYQYLLQNTEKKYAIIHSFDGYDEISLTGSFKVISPEGDQVYEPKNFGFKKINPIDIDAGSSLKSAAKIFTDILLGLGTPEQNQVVIANSGFAIHCKEPQKTLEHCFEIAEESLASGRAYEILKKIIQL